MGKTSQERGKRRENICPACRTPIDEEEEEGKYLGCDGRCKSWYHIECLDLNDETFQKIVEIAEHVRWFCKDCNYQIDKYIDSDETSFDCNSALQTILTELETVSKNQLDMSKQITFLSSENVSNKMSINEINKKIAINDDGTNETVWPTVGKEGRTQRRRRVNVKDYPDVTGSPNALENSPESESENEISLTQDEETKNQFHQKRAQNHGPLYPKNGNKNQLSKTTWRNRKFDINAPETNESDSNRNDKRTPSNRERVPKENYSGDNTTKFEHRKSVKPIFGRNSDGNCGLTVVSRREWLFVSRLAPEVTPENVKSFVSNLCNSDDVICEKLETRYQTYSSYKVGIQNNLQEVVLDGDKWPTGTLICKYIPKRANSKNWNQTRS